MTGMIEARIAANVRIVNCYEASEQRSATTFTVINVNQGTARKTKNVSKTESDYRRDRPPAKLTWNVFDVQPRVYQDTIRLAVMERHPYTTQTFIPLACQEHQIEYLVVTAGDLDGRPDPNSLEAWLCHGGQGGKCDALRPRSLLRLIHLS